MSRAWGGVLTVTGFVACPCHLPFTLPLVLGVLGGTGLGSFIGANTGLIYGVFTGYFIAGIGVGWYLLNRRQRTEGAVCRVPSRRVRANRRRKQVGAEGRGIRA